MKKDNYTYLKNPQLEGGTFEYTGSKLGILLIHGFTATTTEIRLLADHFKKKGLSVYAPLLPGHGTSAHELNRTKYFQWTTCVEQAYMYLSGKCNQVLIGGESMGGVLSLYLAEKYPEISALFLFSTALMVKRLKYAKYIKYFQPIKDKKLPDDELPWKGYTVYPTFAADQFFRLTRLVKASLSKVSVPTLLFQGNFDRSIDPDNMAYIFSQINSPIKEQVKMENSGHVMLLDKDLNKITTIIDHFLDNHHILELNAGL